MGLKTKIYRALTGSTVRKLVKGADDFCALNLPSVHRKIFLPAKAAAKSALLKFSMTRGKKSARTLKLWTISTRENFYPLVSVVVPNFNHAPFLRQRLDTIFNQTYKNFEVILLEDASTDNSLEILREYQRLHDNTRLMLNDTNSGCVFKQWNKGIEVARGDLIWIAESDDFSAENFLSELVPAFADDAVELAFCRSDFIQDGQKIFTTEQYLVDVPAFDWTKPFAVTGAEFVEGGFGVKNIIPNVSGVLFRKQKNFPASCLSMKLCGDWAFYLDVIKGGCVYYSPNATNFYRVHKNSTSLAIQREPRYFVEHEHIAEYVAQNYKVSTTVSEAHYRKLEEHFFGYYGGKDIGELKRLFHMPKVKRKPNILMGVFAMTIGGGETFPLILANELNRRGFAVTVLDFQMADELSDIRRKLNPNVPLVRLNDTDGLAEVVEQFKIDVIHTHHGATDLAASYVDAKHVITLHGMYEAADAAYLRTILDAVKNVDAFVYIADKNLEPLTGLEAKFIKIGNGLARYPINPVSRADLNIPADSFVACVVSRAIEQKGWQAAIKAVTLANNDGGRRIDLILVGAGEVYNKLQGCVPEFVHMVGFKSNVRDYLAAADVGLLPSEYAGESFPLLIIDSFFAGRPVVSSNLGEVSDMVEDAGIVFDLVDGKVPIDTLAEILRGLADNPVAYEKLTSRVDVVAEKFSIERVAEEYIELYAGLMS